MAGGPHVGVDPGRRVQARHAALVVRSHRSVRSSAVDSTMTSSAGGRACRRLEIVDPVPGHHLRSGADVHPPPVRGEDPGSGRRAIGGRASVTDRCLVALRPVMGRHDQVIRSVEEHSSRRRVVPGRAFAHTVGGGAPCAIARIEERAIGSVWGDGKVLQSPQIPEDRDAGAGLVTARSRGGSYRGARCLSDHRTWRAAEALWVRRPVPQSPMATMRAAMAGFKRVVYRKVYSDASTGDGGVPTVDQANSVS